MSTRTHCDVCDAVIVSDSGGMVSARGVNSPSDRMDLCATHYAGYTTLVGIWKREKRARNP